MPVKCSRPPTIPKKINGVNCARLTLKWRRGCFKDTPRLWELILMFSQVPCNPPACFLTYYFPERFTCIASLDRERFIQGLLTFKGDFRVRWHYPDWIRNSPCQIFLSIPKATLILLLMGLPLCHPEIPIKFNCLSPPEGLWAFMLAMMEPFPSEADFA